MNIELTVNNQIITRTDANSVVRDSIDYLYAVFTFATSEWEEITKTAVFSSESGDYNAILDENNTCLVPWEVLTDTSFTISVFGGSLITANKVKVATIESGYTETVESRVPTEDVYNQIISMIDEIETGAIDEDVLQAMVDEYLSTKGYVTENDVNTIVADYISEHASDLKAIDNIAKTSTSGLVDTYTITYTDETTTTFDVTNGADGTDASKGYEINTITNSSQVVTIDSLAYDVANVISNSVLYLTISALEMPNDNMLHEYTVLFTSSTSGCTIELPDGTSWITEPTLGNSTSYELNIFNGRAVLI